MGKRLTAEVAVPPQPTAEPLEELVLELTDLKFHEDNGVRRPSARARLVYEPATPGQREVASAQSWRLIAPIGPIEAGELSWYLEKYAVWPSHYFRDRARKVEDNLVKWGRFLHDAALPATHTANVVNAWSKISDHAGRRFSVYVDAALEAGAPAADAEAVREAATLLLGLPWELLHDGDGYLFQGAKPTRVRRRLPNTRSLDVSVVAAPIRVLLVTARPEDEACGYIDHRASALPLVDAMEQLGGLVRLHVLGPPTFDALGKELKRAFDARAPYHVVHFDGHGVYDRRVGLGGLCFEDPRDTDKLDHRRHVTVHTDKLGPLLKDYRIPLVFLEACQTAQAEDTSESVASELLRGGVASVVAMSHSVLVETARRFVETFCAGLAHGQRVGDAMLDGQRGLKDDTFRRRIFGAGELHRLDREDAVKLVERVLDTSPTRERGNQVSGAADDAARESIEALVEAVHGHARTLALLAPELRRRGVEATREALVELMAAMERRFPGSREHSLFASVELSLRRMSVANRDRARVLGVFHGGVHPGVLAMMMRWEQADVGALAVELIATGLATPNRYDHLTLIPALCPCLRGRMDAAEREALTARWVEAMRVCRVPPSAGEPERRSRGDADGAGTAEPLCDARPRAARRRSGGDDWSGYFAQQLAVNARQAAAAGARGAGARRRGGGATERHGSKGGGRDPSHGRRP